MKYTELNGLSENIIHALEMQRITELTPIQQQVYKFISDNRDVVACSSTGSGKTLAYLIPIINKLNQDSKYIQSVILVPTQELAIQVHEQIMTIFRNANIALSSQFLIGDGNINRQAETLKNKPAIVVGTPSRVYQLIKMKKLRVHDVKTLVIDEADKLMDKTYCDAVMSIRKSLMKFTQVLLFSASIDKKTRVAANNLTFKAVLIDINKSNNNESVIPKTIKHIFILTDRRERIETMRKIAKAAQSNKTIVFINTKYDLEESLQKLEYHHYNVAALSGNQDKFEKKKALDGFKAGTIQYLLATDVAARGLQIDDVETVINVNLPEEPKEYLHRAGRCGRNGKNGLCISIITENELDKIKKYQKQFNINILQKRLYQGKIVAK